MQRLEVVCRRRRRSRTVLAYCRKAIASVPYTKGTLEAKRLTICLALGALFIAAPALAAPKCKAQGRFYITSSGPWDMNIGAQPGATCFSRFYSAGIVFRQLSIVTAPARGKISIRGVNYVYTAPTSPGPDSFMLRLCGTVQGQMEGCSDLLYSVAVN